jgi:hypothetical protein
MFRVWNYLLVALFASCGFAARADAEPPRPHVQIRGIYGGVPAELLEEGKDPGRSRDQCRLDGLGQLDRTSGSRLLKRQGARVFAEFNTMHVAGYLKDHPDARTGGSRRRRVPAASGLARHLPHASQIPEVPHGCVPPDTR